jgi:hypothetical protein
MATGNGINGTKVLRSSASARNVSPEVTNTGIHTKLSGPHRPIFVQVGSGVRPSHNANATKERKVALGKPKAPAVRFLTGNVPQLNADQLMLCRFILSAELERLAKSESEANPMLEETITAIDLALEAQTVVPSSPHNRQPVSRRPNRVNVGSGGGQMSGLAPRRVQRAVPPAVEPIQPENEPESIDASDT